jgi:hypothetical protein
VRAVFVIVSCCSSLNEEVVERERFGFGGSGSGRRDCLRERGEVSFSPYCFTYSLLFLFLFSLLLPALL